ncbi:MAG: ornithine cyclodeaminase family protein [Acidobacteria bacterium]|nr:ornithine cyclodeaminase family protein [Acidobacteriota bacterium]
MNIYSAEEIRGAVDWREIISLMREALRAYSAGECQTPMPMHIDVPAEHGEAHIKGSYREGGECFVLKIATSFPNNVARGMSSGNGMMLVCSALTGAPLALMCDAGFLTDARTAAVAAMTTQLLGRADAALGIIGSGIQARLQAVAHHHVLPLKKVILWGRTVERAARCRDEIAQSLPDVVVDCAESPERVAEETKLIVTCTASRTPLLALGDVRPGTHIHAVGCDSPGKQELDPEILRRAGLVLVDSLTQCHRLGELQHALSEAERCIEIGAYSGEPAAADAVSVADFTGLGAEDLYIAESCWRKLKV